MDATTSRTVTGAYMALVGIGTGFTLQMANTIAQNSVELRDMGAASASTNLFRTLGGSLGVAIFGSLFTDAIQAHHPGAAGSGAATHADIPTLAGMTHAAKDAYQHVVVDGTQHIFLVGALIAAAGFAAAAFIKEVPLRGKPGAKPAPAAASEPPVNAQ
ncbi:hypothetical protein [Sphaerisporangium fuscum]|uniref:hypothetical protein n=1 Tax=Sphaerisporangium fuscum TaxID=2835868 RepID=UPI002029A6C6|nr:hypothetical protein [Sphaerisporangium fuscum]